MTATDYATLSGLKDTLDLTGETFADTDISLAITAASRAIDTECHRRFWLDDDANQVRYYTPRSRKILEIDDLVTFTSLETDQNDDGVFENVWTLDTDFVLEPLNAPLDGEPWEVIARRQRGHFYLPRGGRKSIKLTGQFGWASVPEEIQQATGILATRLTRRSREAPFGVIGFGMDANNAVRLAKADPDVQMLIANYTKLLTVI